MTQESEAPGTDNRPGASPSMTRIARPSVVEGMTNETGGRMRRNRQQRPRSQAVTVKFSGEEKSALQAAAARRQLAVAAYIADTTLAAAEGRTVPVSDTEREMLGELMHIGNLLSTCRTKLTEAAARHDPASPADPALESAAARCQEAGDRAQDAAIKLARMLHRRR